MIDNVEFARSGKSKCRRCDKRISRQMPRGIQEVVVKQHSGKWFYCWKCSKMIMLEEIRKIDSRINDLYTLCADRDKEIVEEELKDDVN